MMMMMMMMMMIVIIIKPDIIIRDNEKGTCMFIDLAISGDRNVIKKEAEKILKYKGEEDDDDNSNNNNNNVMYANVETAQTIYMYTGHC